MPVTKNEARAARPRRYRLLGAGRKGDDVDPFLQFLQQVREIVEANEGRTARLVYRIAELLDTLINDHHLDFASSAEPGCRFGELLYEDPRTGFAVVLLSWGAESSTAIHEHTTWDVFGILSGRLCIRNYTRDAGTEPVLVAEFEARPGDVTYLVPPDQAIHQIANPARDLALSLHVYESNLERTYGDQPEG